MSAHTAQPATAAAWPDWPTHALQEDLFPVLWQWHAEGQAIVLATLVEVQGSSPRPVGSMLAVAADGRIAGQVSGGCVEAAVAHEAAAVLRDGRVRWLDYGDGSPVMDIRLDCGGRIGLQLRRLDDAGEYLLRWRNARQQRRPFIVAVQRGSGLHRPVADRYALRPDEFLDWHAPPLRLHLVGGDASILALVGLAPPLGIELRVLRPHGPTQAPPGLAEAHYDRRAMELALPGMACDRYSALYSLSHDAAIDDAVVAHGLASSAACIGVLGSRSKARLRLQALRAGGVAEPALARLRMPAGWRIGASSPTSIALGIVAEARHAVAMSADEEAGVKAS